jgi:uncharacterized repeat protein (TIGR03803 family)
MNIECRLNRDMRKFAPRLVVVAFSCLCLFVLTASAQSFTILHTFQESDGAFPNGGMIADSAGNLYGTTQAGALPGCIANRGCGEVFQLLHRGSGWILNVLHRFAGIPDGATPFGKMTFGPDGGIYGTTSAGGTLNPNCFVAGSGCGTIYKLRPQPTACHTALCPWQESIIHRFQDSPSDGSDPMYGELTFDAAGKAYGTTTYGGDMDCSGDPCGTVYEISPSQQGWTEQLIFRFSSLSAYQPVTGVILDNTGNLFGVAAASVYELRGPGWVETVIGHVQGTGGGLVRDASGNYYGTSDSGGDFGFGYIYKLSPAGGGWTQTTLYSFGAGDSGKGPSGNITMDQQGGLYGVTLAGGQFGWGVVYKLIPSGGGYTYSSLHDFSYQADGADAIGPVYLDTIGHIFGVAQLGGDLDLCNGQGCGVIWEITQ